MQKIWTNEEVDTLLSLKDTIGPTEIGKQLGRSCDSVRHKLKSLGITVIKPIRVQEKKTETVTVVSEPIRQNRAMNVGKDYCPNCRFKVNVWDAHLALKGQFVCERAA